MVLSCTGGYNGASLSAGGQYFSPARSSVTNLVARISCYLFENNKYPPGLAGGISYAGEALCYQPRLMRRWYGLTSAWGLLPAARKRA